MQRSREERSATFPRWLPEWRGAVGCSAQRDGETLSVRRFRFACSHFTGGVAAGRQTWQPYDQLYHFHSSCLGACMQSAHSSPSLTAKPWIPKCPRSRLAVHLLERFIPAQPAAGLHESGRAIMLKQLDGCVVHCQPVQIFVMATATPATCCADLPWSISRLPLGQRSGFMDDAGRRAYASAL
jgi:hypothetical protein